MHIAFLTSEYPHPKVAHAAGIATSIKNLAIALTKKNVTVTVFVYQQNENTIIKDQGVTIHLIKRKNYKFLTWYFYRKHIQNYINTIVKTENIDLLEAADWTGITAFMRLKLPLVIRLHGSDAYFCKLDNRKQKFKNFVFEKSALLKAKGYIAPTTFAGEETAKIFGLKRTKIKTIHNGIETSVFQNDSPETYNKNTVLYIGTLIRKKGVLELAQIFNKVVLEQSEAQLVLIGSDSKDIKTGATSTYQLMQDLLSDAAKLQTQYLGKIPYAEVQEQIKKAQVCVFPSFAETQGMVTIESMSLQKPVVNTSIGWAKELIDDGINGYLVHPTDIDVYAAKIVALLKDKTLCLQLGKQARKKVETTFDIDGIADLNKAYYLSIINQNA
ncbi:glycosyltransferase family 4 protein [Olleya sp. R77988]|uniref:glycosyltransferase family 4 protein n=1 Tax=Olleya sp. R77988 TaxID=3093875 RepID=UPI0037CC994E